MTLRANFDYAATSIAISPSSDAQPAHDSLKQVSIAGLSRLDNRPMQAGFAAAQFRFAPKADVTSSQKIGRDGPQAT